MKHYELQVHIQGCTSISGVHDSGDFDTDDAAKAKLLPGLAFLRMHHDKVYYRIVRADGKIVVSNGL